MSFDRYDKVRERLIYLFNIINNRVYSIYIPPSAFLSLEELRERETVNFADSGSDDEYFNTPQLRKMKVSQLLPLINNVVDFSEIGFGNAMESVIEIYEGIQEYIGLWVEMMRDNPMFNSPPISELRRLESLAYLIFPLYLKIKPTQVRIRNKKIIEEDRLANRTGLAGLSTLFLNSGMFGLSDSEDLSFISHLDNYEQSSANNNRVTTYEEIAINNANTSLPTTDHSDSPLAGLMLGDTEPKQEEETHWLFEGD